MNTPTPTPPLTPEPPLAPLLPSPPLPPADAEAERMPFVRVSPKKAPFRRAGIHFATLAAVTLPGDELTGRQMLQLSQEPLVDLDVSFDDGVKWERFELPPEARPRRATDAAHSTERAVDPTGPIVPRQWIDGPDGMAVPPEAADPAVPLARPRGGRRGGVAGLEVADRPVADRDRGGKPARR